MITTRLADRYELVEELGRGGMGVVYRARDPVLERQVAVKMIPPALLDAEAVERFQHEARVVAQLDHPAIVSIHDFGRHEGALFFVMPLLEGTALRQLIGEGGLALGEILEIGIQVAEALDYSHERDVVHRDIKPENIMVSRDGGGVRARVMDFGLASGAADSRLSRTGKLLGTPACLSPEQVMEIEVDGRSDLYALGTVLYECLTGAPPFAGALHSVLYRILFEEPARFADHGVEVDGELEELVLACLAKEPAARPQRGRELAEALARRRPGSRVGERPLGAARTPPAAGSEPETPPLVGREAESARLRALLAGALAGECHFALVGGDAGSGKSRLLQELAAVARERRFRVLRGRFSDRGQAFPYQGLAELVQDGLRGRGRKLDLADLAPDLAELFPTLAELPELRRAVPDAPRRRAAEQRAGDPSTFVFELLARTLTRLAGGEPLLLLLENLHAAEASLDALQYIVRRLGPTPTLIVATWRREEVGRGHAIRRLLDSFRDDPRFASMVLEPLPESELRRLLEHLLGSSELRDEMVRRLWQATEGNPLFAGELVRSLLETGGIRRDDSGAWVLSGEEGGFADALPETIQQAVERRLERLSPGLRELLGVASVLGRSFELSDLEALVEAPGEGAGLGHLEDLVDGLVHQGILEEGRRTRGDRLRFTSGAMRDVLYRDLPRRKRRALHRRCARRLEQRYSGRLERVYPRLVHHFSEADAAEETVRYALELAASSLAAASPDAAVRAVRTALELLDEDAADAARREGQLRQLLARARLALGQASRAVREAERAAEAFDRAGSPCEVAEALLLAAEAAWQGRLVGEVRRRVDRGIELARRCGAAGALRRLLHLGATVANLRGEAAAARVYLAEAEELGGSASEEVEEEPVPVGGTLVAALPNPVATIDPARLQTDEELEVSAILFETLLATDADGNLVPRLCEGWQSADGRSFALTLCRDVRFWDGRPLLAADAAASLERAQAIETGFPAAAFLVIDRVELDAACQRRLVIHLLEPLPIFPAFLADPATAIVREQGGRLLGTGPFHLCEQSSSGVCLERNPQYWRGSSAPLERIELVTDLGASGIAAGLRSGALDLGRDLLPADLEQILRDPRFRSGLVEATKKNVYFALLSRSGTAADSEPLRRALFGVIPVHDLVWRTLGRFAQPAVGLIPPGIFGHDPGRRRRPLTRGQAVELLRTAGARLPLRLRAAVHPLFLGRLRPLTDALLAEWAALGAEVEIVTSTIEEFLACWDDTAGIDLWLGRWNADYDDPDDFTHGLFHSESGRLRAYAGDPEVDRLVERARRQGHASSRRQELYGRLEDLLERRGIVLPLFHDVDYRVAGPGVRGLALGSAPPYVDYARLGKLAVAGLEGVRREGRAGGEIHVPTAARVTELDPIAANVAEHLEVKASIFETLTRIDAGARVAPWLAAFFVTEGGRAYHFRLRDKLRFHDGRRLTARDVRYSFERLLQTRDSDLHFLLLPIRGARQLRDGGASHLAGLSILSATELVLELERPLPYFPALLTHPGVSVVPEGSRALAGSWRDGCVGSGPFRVVRLVPGERLELEKSPGYWRRAHPKSDRLVFHFGVDPEHALAELRRGDVCLASDPRPADLAALRRDPQLASCIGESPRLATAFVALNTHRGPLADGGVRGALLGALDVDTLLRGAVGQGAVRAHGLIPPGMLGYEGPRPAGAWPAADTAALAGLHLTVALHPAYLGQYAVLWQALRTRLGELGIEVELARGDLPELVRQIRRGAVDLTLGRWLADYPDADAFAVGVLHSREGVYGGLCGTPETDRLIDAGRYEADPALRHALYRQIEEEVARRAAMLPLFHEQTCRVRHPEIRGFRLGFSLPEVHYDELYWEP